MSEKGLYLPPKLEFTSAKNQFGMLRVQCPAGSTAQSLFGRPVPLRCSSYLQHKMALSVWLFSSSVALSIWFTLKA